MEYNYLKKGLSSKVLTTDYDITSQGYETGSTMNDYFDDKYVVLNAEQVEFYHQHPWANPLEIYNAQMTPPPPKTLDQAKNEMINNINNHFNSIEVLGAYYFNQVIWIENEERVELKFRFDTYKAKGETNVTFYYDNIALTMTVDEALDMLYTLEYHYAECDNFRKALINAVNSLNDINEVENFDYESGYPVKPDVTPEQPVSDVYSVQYKLVEAHPDNDISSVNAGDRWKSTIFPEEGYAILRADFTAEMGGLPIPVEFEEDLLQRPEYASSAKMEINNVSGNIFVATAARN